MAIVFHEFAHAAVAHGLGDPTPRRSGRLTLNPLAHFDPVGVLMLLFAHFGWARPVQVNPAYFANPRLGMLYVAAAGPAANVLTASVALLLWKWAGPEPWSPVVRVYVYVVLYNVWLAVFNLIPIPPLDGSRILAALAGGGVAAAMDRLQAYGWLLLILLVWSGMVGRILNPLSEGVLRTLDALTDWL